MTHLVLGIAIVVAASVLAVLLWQRQAAPPEEPAVPPSALPASPEAQALAPADIAFQRGLAAWNLRTPQSLQTALKDFGEAVKLDPLHARAWAGLSMTWFLLPSLGQAERADAARRSLEAAREAVRLAPGDAMVQTALGAALGANSLVGAGSTEALAAYDLAIALDPGYAIAHHWRAVALTEIDRLVEAEASVRRALELAPDLLPARSHLVLVLALQARWPEALAEGEELQRRGPEQSAHLVTLFLAASMLERATVQVDALRRWLRQYHAQEALADGILAALGDRAAVPGARAGLVEGLDRGMPRGPVFSLLAAIGEDAAIGDWLSSQGDPRAAGRYAASPYARMNRALADHWRARQAAAPH